MNEQMDLFTTELTEKRVFEILLPELQSVLAQNNLSLDALELKCGKNYSSVYFSTALAFRICSRNDNHYFGVPPAYADCASNYISCEEDTGKKRDGFMHMVFMPTEKSVLFFADMLCLILDAAIDSIPKEFDCCSRVEECSDARKCINPYPELALRCGYRKIMKSGRIFYGKNRNID